MPPLSKQEYYAQQRVAASYYDFSFGGPSGQWVEQREAAYLVELIGAARSVLDLACGEGRIAARLDPATRTVAADTSMPMLQAARQRQIRRPACMDAFHLSFAAGSFECVVCARLLFHYPNFEAILRELARVTTDDGWVVFDTFRWSPRARLPLLRTSFDGPIFTTSVDEVQRRLARENWIVLERRGCFLFSPLLYRYLPLALVRLLGRLEKICPDRALVKDYWKVRKQRSGA